jgi:hypothetical protein
MAEFIKNLKKKVEHYKTKAEEIRAMIEEGAETIRDIRADVESTVEDLKADSEEKMMESLEKIQDAERVFKEAGYKLHAVKMEMGFNPKVVTVLRREKEIGTRQQERLVKQHADNKLVKSMLTSLFKAETLEDKVHLRDLTFSEVHIEVGMVPAVHVLWVDQSADAKKAAGRPRRSTSSSPFTSSRSSFTSSSSFSSSSSSAFEEEPEELEEEAAEYEEEPEELVEEEPEAEAEVEETLPAPKKKQKKKKSSGPVVTTSARDPEDDKWVSFPDVSFPKID